MASLFHEVLHQLFRARPELLTMVVRDFLGINLPSDVLVTPADSDQSEPIPAHQYSDAAFVLRDVGGDPVMGVIVEAQLSEATQKRIRWPHYATSFRVAQGVPVGVLVIAPDADVAEWAAEPITIGPGHVMQPLVLGPQHIPIVTDVVWAKQVPELAVLSAMAHGDSEVGFDVATTALQAAADLDDRLCRLYWEAISAAVGPTIAKALEEHMFPRNEIFTREYFQKHVQAGRAQHAAEAVLDVLEARGFTVSDAERKRISECSDEAQLNVWHRRAVTAETVAAVFEG